jgi:hypothetical protein
MKLASNDSSLPLAAVSIAFQKHRTAQDRLTALQTTGMKRSLAHCFFLKDCCALPDQMSFVLTFPWRRFVLAMKDRHCAYQE